MTIDESILYLRRKFPEISPRVAYDVDSKGESFCELFMPCKANENLPISITVTSDGCLFSVGRMHNVMGKEPISAETCAAAIGDVVDGKILFVFGYKNEDDYADSKVFFHRFFALTGREDDMSEEYSEFLATLEKKPSWLERKFGGTVGIFEISSFDKADVKIIKRM